MTRQNLWIMTPFAALACWLPAMQATPKGSRIGAVDGPCSPGIEPHCRNVVSVLVDDAEVLNRCYAASEPQGFADCFKENEKGEKYAVGPGLRDMARERLTGVVRMRLKGEAIGA